jgi:hypothetical protein
MTDPRPVCYRHHPAEPIETVAELKQRVAASGKRLLFGVCGQYKWLAFWNADNSIKLCRPPLSRAERNTIPEPAEREHQGALARLREPAELVSGLAPDPFGRGR